MTFRITNYKKSIYNSLNIVKAIHPFFSYLILSYVFSSQFEHFDAYVFFYLLFFVRLLLGLSFRSFKLSYKFASVEEIISLSLVMLFGTVFVYLLFKLFNKPILESILFVEFLLSFFIVSGLHIVYRVKDILLYHFSDNRDKRNILIIGDGLKTSQLVREFKNNKLYNIVGVVSSNDDFKIDSIHGIRIIKSGISDLKNIFRQYYVDELVFVLRESNRKDLENIISISKKSNVQIRILPNRVDDAKITLNSLRNIKLMDLLERKEIDIDFKKVSNFLNNKKILVTGAAGSIGSELCRQISKFGPNRLILCDIAETPLYEIDIELTEKHHANFHKSYICDIRNEERMRNIFLKENIDIVFHAAAYKHVPLMEYNIEEALSTNVKGTQTLAEISHEFGIKNFIMISTDKAVNPTNVMGCTKRIAELFVQSLNSESKTDYVTTRFGNVLGSNGSVIPRFRNQISKGGPVTVTHREITRYFMLIPESVKLVLQAATMGKGGEIYLFDMGKPVKIINLAEKLIKLSGFEPYKDIKIEFSGLRPGEKIYEELLVNGEDNIATEHEKIVCAQSIEYDYEKIKYKIDNLISLKYKITDEEKINLMKELVEEYEPNRKNLYV